MRTGPDDYEEPWRIADSGRARMNYSGDDFDVLIDSYRAWMPR